MLDLLLLVIFVIALMICTIAKVDGTFIYNVGVSIVAAYIFYIAQILVPKMYKRIKYKKFVWLQLNKIENKMKDVIEMLSGEHNLKLEDKKLYEKAETFLASCNVFENGSNYITKGEEKTIIDAVHIVNEEIHTVVIELINLDIITHKEKKLLLQVEQCELRDKVEWLMKNKPGIQQTMNFQNGQTSGRMQKYGALIIDVLKNMLKDYIDVAQKLEKYNKKHQDKTSPRLDFIRYK